MITWEDITHLFAAGKRIDAMKLICQGHDILKLIPQRDPIVMVDAFYGIENSVSYSGLTIREDNIFVEDGLLSELGVIEHIAQSAAAREGYERTINGAQPSLGYIGSINNLKVMGTARVNETLFTSLKPLYELGGITLIHASTNVGERVILECEMKIFLKKDQK